MSVRAAVLSSWTLDPPLLLAALTAVIVYVRGWAELTRQMPERFPSWRLTAFVGGIATLVAAVLSPLDAFAALLLQAHMIQHLLLIVVAPALILLGAPAAPLLRGLPGGIAKTVIGPFLASPGLRRIAEAIAHPAVCWFSMAAAMWVWHLPGPYQLAVRSPSWHVVEHMSFVATGLLFWWPVVQPWPSVPRWPRWTLVPYLLLADIQNTALAALLTFSDRLLYPVYANVPRLYGIAPLDDQVAAGAIMWVPMSLAYLVPAAVITVRALSPSFHRLPRYEKGSSIPPFEKGGLGGISLTAGRMVQHEIPPYPPSSKGGVTRPGPGFDLLLVPLLGPILRAPSFRRVAQGVLLCLALAVTVDGLLGPQISPMNLAGVLPWTHWRGLTVIALLAAGNFFCMACPFMLPRALGRRLGLARWSWPRGLRSKWPAVGLLITFFWAYEALGVWDSPRATSWLIILLFAGAFTVDAFFRGASFCKYVCPIGQFHFVQSLVSPLEVSVRQPDACARCTTHDCIRGNARRCGCELELFLPRKDGNLDCTFCLDCVHACPHDNIGLLATAPGRTLLHDRDRSSLGRLSRRPDIAALAVLLVFAAFVSAGTMVTPIVGWLDRLRTWVGASDTIFVVSGWIVASTVLVPAILIALAAVSGRALARVEAPAREIVCRFALALIPLGAAMWAAHFLLHFLSGWRAALPVLQRAAADAGMTGVGTPQWALACPSVGAGSLLGVELFLLDVGLLLSLYSSWRIARSYATRTPISLRLLTPWASVAVALYASGVWIFFQPMQMRGLMVHAVEFSAPRVALTSSEASLRRTSDAQSP